MSRRPTDSSFLQQLKDGSGFWLPNDLVDLHAEVLGPFGVFLYVILARAITPSFYPSVKELAFQSRMPAREVRKKLLQLASLELLNDNDLERLRGYYYDRKGKNSSGKSHCEEPALPEELTPDEDVEGGCEL